MFTTRHFKSLFWVLMVVLVAACSKDSNEKVKVDTEGFTVKETFLMVDNQRIKENEVLYGKVLFLFVSGLEGFTYKDNKAYLGCSMTVKDKDGKVMTQADDIFAQYDATGVPPEYATGFSIHVETGNPMKPNETYTWEARFWDKVGKAEIKTEVNFKVLGGAPTEVKVEKSGLEVATVFLSQNQRKLEYEEVELGSAVVLHVNGINGFVADEQGMVSPDAEMSVVDETGKEILGYKDLYASVGTQLNAQQAGDLNLTLALGKPVEIGKYYTWKIRIWDKATNAAFTAESRVKIIQSVAQSAQAQ